MTVVDAIVIGLGGFIGAVLRLLISARMNKKEGIPIGTLVVNLTGSLLIGFLIGLELPKLWTIFLVSGFLGAFTTFSTLMKELLQLWRSGKRKESLLYCTLSFVLGVVLAYGGYVIGQ
ncbi:fluoride efflux transporter CrcB [Sporosarcina sp. ACRSL]|uniref:fluoride efflux transporter CrcB n=1 Tax=Sporosarcina sp. ACRSL TaxID=2918215 RepID=UPI001EF7173C|nr:fluoride efflux transporter CrcB [Sporosarcina sp. ACRSL]MCG7342539.1 fluoride efflux transporter CrcB [Sporosarcina sp. ACRSL]